MRARYLWRGLESERATPSARVVSYRVLYRGTRSDSMRSQGPAVQKITPAATRISLRRISRSAGFRPGPFASALSAIRPLAAESGHPRHLGGEFAMDGINVVTDVLNQFAGPKTLVASPRTGAASGGRYLTDS